MDIERSTGRDSPEKEANSKVLGLGRYMPLPDACTTWGARLALSSIVIVVV